VTTLGLLAGMTLGCSKAASPRSFADVARGQVLEITFDGDTVTPGSMRVLADVARCIAADTRLARVTVEVHPEVEQRDRAGSADSATVRGGDVDSRRTAELRARRIWEALVGLGVYHQQIGYLAFRTGFPEAAGSRRSGQPAAERERVRFRTELAPPGRPIASPAVQWLPWGGETEVLDGTGCELSSLPFREAD